MKVKKIPTGNLARVTNQHSRAAYVRRARTKGQALLIIALMMSVLVLFVGLAVDTGNLMSRKSKLQSAVDASALSGAQLLSSGITQTARTKAFQMLEANGVLSNTLNMSVTNVSFPGRSQISVHAVQRVNTFFMRIVPAFAVMEVSADATADLNSYAEINAKPYGVPGVVNELNLMVWGPLGRRQNGDAYSPIYDRNPNGTGAVFPNPEHNELPNGYFFRVDVPAGYSNNHLVVQIFDPDSYNRSDVPPTWPAPPPPPPPGTPTAVPPTPVPDMFAGCNNTNRDMNRYPAPTPFPAGQPPNCTSTNAAGISPSLPNTGLYVQSFSNTRGARPAFWRVDEYRCSYDPLCTNEYQTANADVTRYSLWHFNPYITSAFEDPSTLSDQNGGPLAVYTSTEASGIGADGTDLKWFQPNGFDVTLVGTGSSPCTNPGANGSTGDCFPREGSGGFYFYLYVQGMAGSSENNYDLRVGPPQTGYNCTAPLSAAGKERCYVNKLYFDQMNDSNIADWNDGGALLFAKHSLPLNLDTGTSFPPVLTQINKTAAGQILGVKHFDMDQGPTPLYYQMQKCNVSARTGCTPLSNNNCWGDIPNPETGNARTWGYASANDSWNEAWPSGSNPVPEFLYIPYEGAPGYSTFFGPNGECATSWMRIQNYPSFSQDTSVWELPFIRPRLIK